MASPPCNSVKFFEASVVLEVFGHKVLCVGSHEGLSQTASDEVTFKYPPSARPPWQEVSVTLLHV